jgi:hypothetical protein
MGQPESVVAAVVVPRQGEQGLVPGFHLRVSEYAPIVAGVEETLTATQSLHGESAAGGGFESALRREGHR